MVTVGFGGATGAAAGAATGTEAGLTTVLVDSTTVFFTTGSTTLSALRKLNGPPVTVGFKLFLISANDLLCFGGGTLKDFLCTLKSLALKPTLPRLKSSISY